MTYYRKKYYCVCAGLQEEMYLDHVATLLKAFPKRVVTFNRIIDKPYRLEKSYVEYDCAALFDYDFDDDDFTRNIKLCDRLNNAHKPTKRKKGKYIYHAFSNVNFDLWLILHKEEFNRSVLKNDAYQQDVRRIYGLGSMENIKSEKAIKKILDQITLEDIKNAISRADRIRSGKIDTDKRVIGSTICYPDPDFSIHQFLKVVLADCGEL